jgi:beta-lactamase regulating signal transducer with metallopeptidase domain
MTRIAGWVNAETMRLVGMALLHFLWQGVAIAAAASVAMSLARRAATKYVVAVAMLAVMVAAPALTFFVLGERQEVRKSGAVASNSPGTPQTQELVAPAPTSFAFNFESGDSRKTSSIYLLWLVQGWFTGVVLLSLRPAAGFFLIERLRLKKGSAVSGELRARCLELQRRLGLNRVVHYCESLQLQAPAVVGWFRPVILMPVSALTGLTAPQLEAVIAHELAHVKRLDAFVNLFQMVAETLLFYHPAVWWLSKRVRAERENCCDDVAISVCGNAVEYARALATMAEWQSAPALAMAANRSPLAERVARLLGIGKLSGGLRSAGIAGSVLCLCASVLAGNALLGTAQTHDGLATAAQEQQSTPVVAEPARWPVMANAVSGKATVRVQPVIAGDDASLIEVRPEVKITAPVIDSERMLYPHVDTDWAKEHSAEVSAGENAQENKAENSERRDSERKDPSGSYIEGLKAEGITDVSVGQLIAMRVQGVTPEYVRSIHALGLKPDVGELIAMRVQGVTPELIRELHNSGLALEINQIIAMQVQGVTPEYVKQFRDMFSEADANNLIAMKVQGIGGDYVRDMRAATNSKLQLGELIALKVQGVSPEYVHEMKSMGFELRGSEIVGMKVQGVTPEYVKGLRSAGLKLNAHTVVEAKVMGITPEFVEKARSHGFRDLSMDKLVALKNSGVLD